jgi:hypothetical protein
MLPSIMLRKRKKPPADRANINSGKPWSAMDLSDTPVEWIADFLCRDRAEVEAQIAALEETTPPE